MKNFTLSIKAFLCTALTLLMGVPAAAQTAAEMFGTYEFTATLEITEDGQPYADKFSDKCEVTIEQGGMYDFMITGIGGSTADVQYANLREGLIRVMRTNGDTYYLWGNPVMWGNADGSDYNGPVDCTINPETKEVTIPDFTAVTVTPEWQIDRVLARFTNCKLTFKKQTELEIADLSGEYHFMASGKMTSESTFPSEFDMTLAAKDETFKTYTTTIDFGEGFTPVTLDAAYDGAALTIAFDDVYLDEARTYFLSNKYQILERTGTIVFNHTSETALTLNGRINIWKGASAADAMVEQGYYDGVAVKKGEDADNFDGIYHVVCKDFANLLTSDEYNYKYPMEFDMEIIKDPYYGDFVIGKFVNGDIYSNTMGGYPCTVEGNTLKIPVGDGVLVQRIFMSDDYNTMVWDVLYNSVGEKEGTIDFTKDADGNCTLSDFFLARKTTFEGQVTGEIVTSAYYGNLEVTVSEGTNIAAPESEARKIVVIDGNIRIIGAPAPVKVYNASGVCVYSGVSSSVSGLGKGLYIVTCAGTAVKVML